MLQRASELSRKFRYTSVSVSPTQSYSDEFFDAQEDFMAPSSVSDGVIFHTLLVAEFGLNKISLGKENDET